MMSYQYYLVSVDNKPEQRPYTVSAGAAVDIVAGQIYPDGLPAGITVRVRLDATQST